MVTVCFGEFDGMTYVGVVPKQTVAMVTVTYWPCLARYRDTLGWSIVEAQQREREEVDTVNAFASLSVVPEKSPE